MSERHARAREALRAAEARAREGRESQVGSPGEVEETPDEQVNAALRFVLRSTQNRPQTEAEIVRKLRQREYADETIDQTLSAAKQQGLIDDGAFAAAWVEDRGRQRGFGPVRLREELARRGVGEVDIDTALRQLDDRDDHRTAVELARARARQLPGNLSREALVRRLGGYLMRRGHPPGLAERAAREIAESAHGG